MKHTLVIPTFNRPGMLQRLVQYYFERARFLNLVVLDSSKPQVAQENAKVLASYGDFVRHAVFPETIVSTVKLAEGMALVNTPYASLCGDDDLVFPDGLTQAIDVLERQPDYVCAHGLYVNFRPEGRDIHLGREYSGPSNEASHAGARIFRLFQRYESVFYAVFRSADLRTIMCALPSVSAPHYQELLQSTAAVILGKVQRFASVYAARHSGPPAQPGREKWQTYYWFAENPSEVLEHYQQYRRELGKFYEAHGPAPRLDPQLFARVLDLSHAVYFAAGCPPEYFHSALQAHWPGDSYQDVARVDLFAELGLPRFLARPRSPSLLTNAGYGIGAILSAPYLAFLNYQAARTGGTAWKCRLPVRQRWLATIPAFRKSYLELCRYLDTRSRERSMAPVTH